MIELITRMLEQIHKADFATEGREDKERLKDLEVLNKNS